jgi:hypothetical protein
VTAHLLVAKFKSYEIMAFLPEHSEGPALLASLFGSDVQAWTRDQVILNDEVQSLITQAHVDKKGEWGHIMTLRCIAIAPKTCDLRLRSIALQPGIAPQRLCSSTARLVIRETDIDL